MADRFRCPRVLVLIPVSLEEACAFVGKHHRHHKPPHRVKFQMGVSDGTDILGVCMVGRPVSRHLDDGHTLEVVRLCTLPNLPSGTSAASKLYRAAWRVALNLGYSRLVTYILDSEKGTSLLAANYKLVGIRGGGSWSRPSRPRVDAAPTCQKQLWEVTSKVEGEDGEE